MAKFENGQVVRLDPANTGRGDRGLVIGIVDNLDGTTGYVVSSACYQTQTIIRNLVNECEIQEVKEQ